MNIISFRARMLIDKKIVALSADFVRRVRREIEEQIS